MLNKLSQAESRVLERIQSVAFDARGVLSTARGLSHFGEHAAGWIASAGVGAVVDKQRRAQWVRTPPLWCSNASCGVVVRIIRMCASG